MSLRTKVVILTVVTFVIFIANTVAGICCGASFGEDEMPELIRN